MISRRILIIFNLNIHLHGFVSLHYQKSTNNNNKLAHFCNFSKISFVELCSRCRCFYVCVDDDDNDDDEFFLWHGWPTIIRGSHHRKSPAHHKLVWTCTEPEFRLNGIKLCSSDNHYIMAPQLRLFQIFGPRNDILFFPLFVLQSGISNALCDLLLYLCREGIKMSFK